MRTPSMKILGTLLLLAPAIVAFRSSGERLTLGPQSRLWVDGTSNVRSFTCTATSFDTDVQTSGPDAAGQVLAGEKAVTTVDVKVPADKLDCANGKMNDHMRKALKAKDNPTVEFSLTSYELAPSDSGVQATLSGSLSLGGTQKPVTILADVKRGDDGALRVTGSYEFKLTDFGLKPPSLMLGAFKVHDPVKVSFDLLLQS
jgi:polyisoprenoid-binding protein YceI